MRVILLISLLILALLVGGGAAVFLLFRLLKDQLAQGMAESLRIAKEDFLQLAAERLGRDHAVAQGEWTQNRQAIDMSLKRMSDEIEKYGRLVKDFESDRMEKYGKLEVYLANAIQETSKLHHTTNHLTSILANVKLRGQWGERVAEDILRSSGLLEGVHYRKNKAQDTVTTRPDYVFLLPNGWKVSMDVKFPLNNYLALVNSENPEKRQGFQVEFIRDVKDRIKEVTQKDYINPAEQTLDCVILFIPNEQVYGFIHEAAPGLLDEAMKQRVVLCSPFTLYAVLAVIRQTFEDFHFRRSASEILARIQLFQNDFETFRARFQDLGDLLGKTTNKYNEITEKSYKRLDMQIRKIDEYRKGHGLLAEPQKRPLLETSAGPSPALLPSSES